MRLLFVIDCLGSGGAQRQMVNLAIGLKRRNHEVGFFVYYPQYDHFDHILNSCGVNVYKYQKEHRYSYSVVPVLRNLVRKGNYDIVLSFLDTPNLYTEIACLGVNTKIVVSERFMDLPGRRNIRRWAFLQAHILADWITVNSYHQSERMVCDFPWMRRKISTIYNGINLDEFRHSRKFPETSTQQLQLLAIGTVTRKKNPLNLIQALAIYREKYGIPPVIRWLGKFDPSPDGKKLFSEILDAIRNLDLSHCWQWLGESSDVARIIQAHDALIHPAFFEGLPNAICEALACGRPVLASNVCDHGRLVEDKVRGFLFDPDSPNSIAASIHQYMQLSTNERNTMGKHARDYAEKELSIHAYISHYEVLFHKLCEVNK